MDASWWPRTRNSGSADQPNNHVADLFCAPGGRKYGDEGPSKVYVADDYCGAVAGWLLFTS